MTIWQSMDTKENHWGSLHNKIERSRRGVLVESYLKTKPSWLRTRVAAAIDQGQDRENDWDQHRSTRLLEIQDTQLLKRENICIASTQKNKKTVTICSLKKRCFYRPCFKNRQRQRPTCPAYWNRFGKNASPSSVASSVPSNVPSKTEINDSVPTVCLGSTNGVFFQFYCLVL